MLEAHLGVRPSPPSNSILAESPADLMDLMMERSFRGKTPCLTSNWSSEEEEECEVRKMIKRKKKKLVRKAPELNESEEEEDKRDGVKDERERKPAIGHFYSRKPTLSTDLTKEKIPNLTDSSADEAEDDGEDEAEEGKGGSTVLNNLTKEKIPYLTHEKIQEPPNLADSSDDNKEEIQGNPQFCGSMRGGAGSSPQEILNWIDLIEQAILGHLPPLKLDELTPGFGDCFSEAIVQQCQRPPIKLYLQSRGITISNMLQLKAKVAEFVNVNKKARKLQDLRVNFEASQLNMRHEGLPARTWREYWADMQRSGPWADDHFVQCTAWYLNVRLSILYVGSETEGKTTTSIDGQFFPSAPGESQPVMYLGYIVNTHYQSLLPQVEDNTMPAWLAPPAIDNTLQRTLQCLQSMQQGSQVSKVAQAVNIFSSSLLQAQASVPISHDTPNQSYGNDQVRMDS